MRILLVHNMYQQSGGEDTAVQGEHELLSSAGHEVRLYILKNEEIRHYDAWQKLLLGPRTVWSSRCYREIKRLVREFRPDIAHFHNIIPLVSPSAYYACRALKVPVVQTLHNYRLACPSATLYRNGSSCVECVGRAFAWPGVAHGCYRGSRAQTSVVAMTLGVHKWIGTWRRMVDVYVSLTEFARSQFVRAGLPPHKVEVRPNFVYPDPGGRTSEGRNALFVGRLSPEKGLRTLLNAWAKDIGVPLKIVGDGPLSPEVNQRSAAIGRTVIEILGPRPRDRVLTLIKSSQFVVIPSECYEGFPMVLAEAFACGVPVIASRIGALAEIVDDGVTGLHHAPGDHVDLAAKVDWARKHPAQMALMGKEARRVFEQRYSSKVAHERLMTIYHRASSQGGR